MTDRVYYTYGYLRQKDSKISKAGTLYYVGKGKGSRAFSHHRNTPVPKDRNRIIFLKENLTEKEAFDHEIEMIKFYGRVDIGTGILRNLTDGGEGPSNPSPETRKKAMENKKWYYDQHPEMFGGSLGRTKEQHSADSKRAAKKGIVQWTKDKWENDPEWAAERREISRQTGLKNAELGIGIAGLTKEQRSANTKALFEGEDGEERKEFYRKRAKEWSESGTGMYSEEAKQKKWETYYKNGYNMDTFTVVSPWGETFSEKGIKPFCRKMGISHTSLASLIHGETYMVNGWHLPENDPLLPLKLFREGKTKEEVGKILGIEITSQVTFLFPPPKEGYKWCPSCFQELPLDNFWDNVDKYGNKGKRSSCKKCCMPPEERKRRELLEKGLKECKTCGEVLPLSKFRVGRYNCKSCVSIKYKKPKIKKNCICCGESFTATKSDQKYCTPICKNKSRPSRYVKKRPTFPPAKEGYKWCSCCKQELPFSKFWKDKDKKDGYTTQCKSCKRS